MKGDTFQPKYTVLDLGYHFNKAGELRTIEGDEVFQFTTQEEYENLGEAVTHEVYDLLEKLGLQRIVLKKPGDTGADHEFSFVFASPDFDSKDTLLVLIHGSGAVRAGQWGRRLILNENLDRGSQIPYIERAMANDWGILVMNANNNSNFMNDQEIPLRYSKDSAMHAVNCWYRFVKYARCSRIFVVAHSRGGQDISRIVDEFPTDNRIEVICLTDAPFQFSNNRATHPLVINWAAQPLCSMERPVLGDPKNRSEIVHQIWAGTNEHDRTSYMAMESIYHVLEHYDRRNSIDCLLHEAWDIVDALYNPERTDKEVVNCSTVAHVATYSADYANKCSEDYVVQEGIITDFNVSGDIIYEENPAMDSGKPNRGEIIETNLLKRKLNDIPTPAHDLSQKGIEIDDGACSSAKKILLSEHDQTL